MSDWTKITQRSFRAGFATDMINAGMPASIIKAIGRRKSDAYLCYYRPDQQEAAQLGEVVTKALLGTI